MPLLDVRQLLDDREALPPPEGRREIRERAGISLRQAGDAIGVSATAIALWERGEHEPRPQHLRAYVALLRELDR